MLEYFTLPTIIFSFLSLLAIGFSLYSIRQSYIIAEKKIDFWNNLGNSLLTIAGIFIATTTILITLSIKKVETEAEHSVNIREKIIRELVQWEVNVTHVPNSKTLDLELFCFKTENTLAPKTINVTIEVVYQDEYRMPASHPVTRTFKDIRLQPISENKLFWKISNIKNIWNEFKDSRGYISDISVLERPLSVNFVISYNLDMYAAAQANLYPEINNDIYLTNGLNMNVILNQISPKIGE